MENNRVSADCQAHFVINLNMYSYTLDRHFDNRIILQVAYVFAALSIVDLKEVVVV